MKFILEITSNIKNDNAIVMVEILLRFNYDLLARAYDNNIME